MPTIYLPETLTRRQRRTAIDTIRAAVLRDPAFNGAEVHIDDTYAPFIWADCSPRIEADVCRLINAINATIQALPPRPRLEREGYVTTITETYL